MTHTEDSPEQSRCWNSHFFSRVTAKSRYSVVSEMMTKGRVDLSKATKMPKFTKDLPSNVRVLRNCPLRLECAFEGEPAPSVKWMRTRSDIEASITEDGETWVSTYNTQQIYKEYPIY